MSKEMYPNTPKRPDYTPNTDYEQSTDGRYQRKRHNKLLIGVGSGIGAIALAAGGAFVGHGFGHETADNTKLSPEASTSQEATPTKDPIPGKDIAPTMENNAPADYTYHEIDRAFQPGDYPISVKDGLWNTLSPQQQSTIGMLLDTDEYSPSNNIKLSTNNRYKLGSYLYDNYAQRSFPYAQATNRKLGLPAYDPAILKPETNQQLTPQQLLDRFAFTEWMATNGAIVDKSHPEGSPTAAKQLLRFISEGDGIYSDTLNVIDTGQQISGEHYTVIPSTVKYDKNHSQLFFEARNDMYSSAIDSVDPGRGYKTMDWFFDKAQFTDYTGKTRTMWELGTRIDPRNLNLNGK